jgi:hypothetical protein
LRNKFFCDAFALEISQSNTNMQEVLFLLVLIVVGFAVLASHLLHVPLGGITGRALSAIAIGALIVLIVTHAPFVWIKL